MKALCFFPLAIMGLMALTATALPAAIDLTPITNNHSSTAASVSNAGIEGTISSSIPPFHTTPILGSITPAPTSLTVAMINSHDSAITTSHAHGAGDPTASGEVGHGTIEAGATASFVAPKNWSGIVAVNDAMYEITTNDSLIEGSFKWVEMYHQWVVDLDVSYV